MKPVRTHSGGGHAAPGKKRNLQRAGKGALLHFGVAKLSFWKRMRNLRPVVPAGKRVRVTRLEGFFINFINTTVNGFAALELNDDNHPVVMFPVVLFQGAFFGNVFAFNQEVDFNFEAGQTPFLVVGVAGLSTIALDPRNWLSIAGYMVDLTP